MFFLCSWVWGAPVCPSSYFLSWQALLLDYPRFRSNTWYLIICTWIYKLENLIYLDIQTTIPDHTWLYTHQYLIRPGYTHSNVWSYLYIKLEKMIYIPQYLITHGSFKQHWKGIPSPCSVLTILLSCQVKPSNIFSSKTSQICKKNS